MTTCSVRKLTIIVHFHFLYSWMFSLLFEFGFQNMYTKCRISGASLRFSTIDWLIEQLLVNLFLEIPHYIDLMGDTEEVSWQYRHIERSFPYPKVRISVNLSEFLSHLYERHIQWWSNWHQNVMVSKFGSVMSELAGEFATDVHTD